MSIWWTVLVTIHDKANDVVGTLEGWQLSETTLDKIQQDVDEFLKPEEYEMSNVIFYVCVAIYVAVIYTLTWGEYNLTILEGIGACVLFLLFIGSMVVAIWEGERK